MSIILYCTIDIWCSFDILVKRMFIWLTLMIRKDKMRLSFVGRDLICPMYLHCGLFTELET